MYIHVQYSTVHVRVHVRVHVCVHVHVVHNSKKKLKLHVQTEEQ